MLAAADAVLAVLDGPDADSGTAAEVGWAAARGTPVVGWRSDFRLADHEAARVNLQVEDFVIVSGGTMAPAWKRRSPLSAPSEAALAVEVTGVTARPHPVNMKTVQDS